MLKLLQRAKIVNYTLKKTIRWLKQNIIWRLERESDQQNVKSKSVHSKTYFSIKQPNGASEDIEMYKEVYRVLATEFSFAIHEVPQLPWRDIIVDFRELMIGKNEFVGQN